MVLDAGRYGLRVDENQIATAALLDGAGLTVQFPRACTLRTVQSFAQGLETFGRRAAHIASAYRMVGVIHRHERKVQKALHSKWLISVAGQLLSVTRPFASINEECCL